MSGGNIELKPVGPAVDTGGAALLSKPALSVALVLAVSALLEYAPGLERFRLFGARPDGEPTAEAMFQPDESVGEAEITTETKDQPGLAQQENAKVPSLPRGPIAQREGATRQDSIEVDKPPLPLLDPTGKALDGFYRALSNTARKEPGAITRVGHFGDSVVVSDYVSATLRRKLHEQFGDAGHGFVLLANAWPAYFHNDVYRFASRGFKVSRIVGPTTPDGLYGLGGVSFKAPPGVRARVGSAKEGKYGRRVSRFTLSYLEQPGGGTFKLNLDGQRVAEVDSNGPTKRARAHTVETTDGEHELEILTGPGMTRAFGVVLERDGPGVVLDALGVQGARIRFLDKQDDAHWAEQLRWRSYDLVIYQFGANESGDGFAYPMPEYNKTMRAVIEQQQKALPAAGCLVIGAMDRARKEDEGIRSMRIIPLIVAEQKKVSMALGCAFFNTYKAMGGSGSMPTWVRRGLGQADLTHPTGVGAQVLGKWIYRALMDGYNEYLKRQRG